MRNGTKNNSTTTKQEEGEKGERHDIHSSDFFDTGVDN